MEDVVHRMNEEYRACGALENVLSNRGLGIKAKKCLYEAVIVPTASDAKKKFFFLMFFFGKKKVFLKFFFVLFLN